MPSEAASPPSLVAISFVPSQRSVSKISNIVNEFCEMLLRDEDLASRVHMTVYELVENLFKYGSDSPAEVQVELVREEDGTSVSVSTRNSAPPERLTRAVQLLTRVRAATDPIAFLDGLVLETLPRVGESGLGLARIRAEGGLAIDFHVSGSELSIMARGKFQEGRQLE